MPLFRRASEPIIDTKNKHKLPQNAQTEGVTRYGPISGSSISMPKYYARNLDRDAAEKLLRSEPDGTYLVRDRQSSNTPGSYTLSMRETGSSCKHYRIDTNPETHKLSIYGYEDMFFDSLENLVNFFIQNQRTVVPMKPYQEEKDPFSYAIYESMDENNVLYENIDEAGIPRIPNRHPPNERQTVTALRSYENVHNKHFSPPGPLPGPLPSQTDRRQTQRHSYENIDRGTNSSHLPGQSRPKYENLPPKSETLPVPPRMQPGIATKSALDRRASLPTNLSHDRPPSLPPLPLRQNGNYQNLPGRGTVPIPENDQPRLRKPRSYTDSDVFKQEWNLNA